MTNGPLDSNFEDDLNEYERWIDMGWGVNKHEDDDILPIISIRDDLHIYILSQGKNIQDTQINRLQVLDKRWQDFISKNHDPSFKFNFRDFDKDKSQWWWWIDRLSELTEAQRSTI